MGKGTKSVLVIMLLILTATPVVAQVSYDGKSGRLSATYHGAPLRDVLAEISRRTGIAVYIDPAVDKVVFIEKKNRPVDEVLNEIIAPLNNMLIYRGTAVVAVRVYEQVPADATQVVAPPAQPSAVAPRQDRVEAAPQPAERPAVVRSGRQKKIEEQKAARERRRQAGNRGSGVLD